MAQLAEHAVAIGDHVVLVDRLQVLLAGGDEDVIAELGQIVDDAADHLAHAVLDEARAAAFGADALVVPLGVDTYDGDPISHFRLGPDDFPRIGTRLAALGLPTAVVMEGGYAVAAIGENVAAVLGGLSSG